MRLAVVSDTHYFFTHSKLMLKMRKLPTDCCHDENMLLASSVNASSRIGIVLQLIRLSPDSSSDTVIDGADKSVSRMGQAPDITVISLSSLTHDVN